MENIKDLYKNNNIEYDEILLSEILEMLSKSYEEYLKSKENNDDSREEA